MVRVGRLVLHADAGFAPRVLPKHAFAPIYFRRPCQLRISDRFDAGPALETSGSNSTKTASYHHRPPVCQPASLAGTTTRRQAAARAIVGSGTVAASIAPRPPGGRAALAAESLQRPPRQRRRTVIAHARALVPTPQTYVILITIEKLKRGPSPTERRRHPRIRGRHRIPDPPRSRSRPPLQVRRRQTLLCLRQMHRQRPRDPRPFDSATPTTVIEGSVFKACTPIS